MFSVYVYTYTYHYHHIHAIAPLLIIDSINLFFFFFSVLIFPYESLLQTLQGIYYICVHYVTIRHYGPFSLFLTECFFPSLQHFFNGVQCPPKYIVHTRSLACPARPMSRCHCLQAKEARRHPIFFDFLMMLEASITKHGGKCVVLDDLGTSPARDGKEHNCPR